MVTEAKPFTPAPLYVPRLAQYVVRTSVSLAKLRADQDTMPKSELCEMVFDAMQVVITELLRDHRKECTETRRMKLMCVVISQPPQPLEQAQYQLQHIS